MRVVQETPEGIGLSPKRVQIEEANRRSLVCFEQGDQVGSDAVPPIRLASRGTPSMCWRPPTVVRPLAGKLGTTNARVAPTASIAATISSRG